MNIREYIASGIVELYVMGLCTVDEKREVEELRREYPELEAAIREYELELEQKLQQEAKLPSPETDKKILASLDVLSKTDTNQPGQAVVKKINWLKPLAAAAVLLLIASVYFLYSLNRENKSLKQQLSEMEKEQQTLPASDYKIMLDPRITPVAMYGVGIHSICRCTMFWDKKTGKMYVIIHHLPQSSAQQDYQLWAMVNNQPVSVGILQDEIRGRFIEMSNVPADANAFIVTLEKTGGSSQPTMEETYLSGKI